MGLVVYLDPFTINSRKVLAALDLANVKYDLKTMDCKSYVFAIRARPQLFVVARAGENLTLQPSSQGDHIAVLFIADQLPRPEGRAEER